MAITVKSIELNNFAKFSRVKIEFDPKVTYLIGVNGSGKTTLGASALQAIIQGVAEKASVSGHNPLIGERFRFIGQKATNAKGIVVLYDEKKKREIIITRKITKSENPVTIEATDGEVLDREWLNSLFNAFLLAPKMFTELSPRQQALQLGIDTSAQDSLLADLKVKASVIDATIKSMGTLVDVAETQKEDIVSLVQQKQDLFLFNQAQIKKQEALTKAQSTVTFVQQQITAVEDKLKQLKAQLEEAEKARATLPPAEPAKEAEMLILDEKMARIQEINQKAADYQGYLEKKTLLATKQKEKEDNKAQQKTVQEERTGVVKKMKLPFSNMEISEEGELLLNGKIIKEPYFSKGEILKIATRILKFLKPELQYVFLQDFDLLDKHNQPKVIEELVKEGFQVVVEHVGENKIEGKSCILLKDQKVVDSYEEVVGEELDV